MEIFVYRKGAHSIEEGFTAEELPELLADETNVVWVDFLGETAEELNRTKNILLNTFKFHYLTVEDCIETRNQPKVEAFPEYLYLIVHGVKPEETNPANFATKELDAYLGKNYVVTFHTERFRSIKTVKQQIRSNTYACQRGAAYLLHQILDQLVDLYMPLVDDFDAAINNIEERVFRMQKSDTAILEEIMDLRRSVARLKRISARQLDVLYRISHAEFSQIPEQVLPFYRDVHDHLLRISDLSENYRDLVAGLFDIHFSMVANKTNEVMKTLAVLSAIMLPLTLIAGVFGMNTKLFPDESKWDNLYYIIGTMFIITLLLVYYFWRKGWIFEKRQARAESEDKEMMNAE